MPNAQVPYTKVQNVKSTTQDTNTVLNMRLKDLVVYTHSGEDNKQMYDQFYELFGIYLQKIRKDDTQKYISELYKRKLICLGHVTGRQSGLYAGSVIDNDSLTGVVLVMNDLDIDMSGDTNNIDQCIYSVYFGLCQGVTKIEFDNLFRDSDIHKLCCAYLNALFLRALGKGNDRLEPEKKERFRLGVMYHFYKFYLNKKHPEAIAAIKKYQKDTFDKEFLETEIKKLETCSKYSEFKDLPKILIDLNVISLDQNKFMFQLIQLLGTTQYLNISSSIFRLIGVICTVNHSTVLFDKNVRVNSSIHENIEKILLKNISHLKFKPTQLLG